MTPQPVHDPLNDSWFSRNSEVARELERKRSSWRVRRITTQAPPPPEPIKPEPMKLNEPDDDALTDAWFR